MSADNYMYVQKTEDGQYMVTMEWMSDDSEPASPRERLARLTETGRMGGYTKLFDTLQEAEEYAISEDSEYGVFYGFLTRVMEVEDDG